MRATRVFVALCAVLQACASPEPPVASTLAVPSEWQGKGGSLPVDSHWWLTFNDPVLNALVAEALRNNLDLRQATARLSEAHAMTRAERGAELPVVRGVGGGNRSKQVSDVTLEPYLSTNHEFEVQASYEVDLWGRVRDLSSAARASEESIRLTRDAVGLSVAASVASGYVGLREIDAKLQLAIRTADSRQHSLALARERERNGYASTLETAQAEAEWRAAKQVIPQLELAQEKQEQSIIVLLGRSSGQVERGLPLLELTAPPIPSAGVPSQLLRRRPDIASAESQVAAADAQLAAARAQMLPSFNLAASVGRVSSSILRGDPFTVWSLGGSILAPIFNGGELRAKADASAARREQALIAYQRTVINAFSEVENRLSAYAKEKDELTEAEFQSAALAESLRIATRRHAEGYSSYLDELVAERSLFSVQQSVLGLHADALTTVVSTYRALGGGWSTADLRGE